jgi:hypothetical protein
MTNEYSLLRKQKTALITESRLEIGQLFVLAVH